MNKKLRISLIVILLSVFSVISLCSAQEKSEKVKVVDKIEVKGEFTYKHCLNECGIQHDHYITNANVMIYNDCMSDYECAQCLDECAEELKENNEEVYWSMMETTKRSEM